MSRPASMPMLPRRAAVPAASCDASDGDVATGLDRKPAAGRKRRGAQRGRGGAVGVARMRADAAFEGEREVVAFGCPATAAIGDVAARRRGRASPPALASTPASARSLPEARLRSPPAASVESRLTRLARRSCPPAKVEDEFHSSARAVRSIGPPAAMSSVPPAEKLPPATRIAPAAVTIEVAAGRDVGRRRRLVGDAGGDGVAEGAGVVGDRRRPTGRPSRRRRPGRRGWRRRRRRQAPGRRPTTRLPPVLVMVPEAARLRPAVGRHGAAVGDGRRREAASRRRRCGRRRDRCRRPSRRRDRGAGRAPPGRPPSRRSSQTMSEVSARCSSGVRATPTARPSACSFVHGMVVERLHLGDDVVGAVEEAPARQVVDLALDEPRLGIGVAEALHRAVRIDRRRSGRGSSRSRGTCRDRRRPSGSRRDRARPARARCRRATGRPMTLAMSRSSFARLIAGAAVPARPAAPCRQVRPTRAPGLPGPPRPPARTCRPKARAGRPRHGRHR